MGSQRDCTWILDVPGFQVTTITGEGREAQRRLRVHVDRRGASVIFRHQVLLRRDRHVHDGSRRRPARVSERQHVAQPRDYPPQKHEDVPKGQPPRGMNRTGNIGGRIR